MHYIVVDKGDHFSMGEKECVVDEVEGEQALTCIDEAGDVEVRDMDEVDLDELE